MIITGADTLYGDFRTPTGVNTPPMLCRPYGANHNLQL